MKNPGPGIQKLAQKLKTPLQVQKFLKTLKYNRELDGETVRSAEQALKLKTAHCLEACLIPPLLSSYRGIRLNGKPRF